jgi:GT2 family glycosyltransferase
MLVLFLQKKGNIKMISIIILNYNAGNLLMDCVSSVMSSNLEDFEIILVDNLSSDNSHLECKKKFDKVILIENKENLGYCEGNNVGLRIAKGEFIIVLNPDTTVTSNWLTELKNAYDKFGEGLYQPKILSMSDPKKLGTTGNMINIFGFGFSRGRGDEDTNQYNEIEEIGYASGTCLFMSAKTFEKIGFLDSFLFAYHDDLEYGWRAHELDIKSYYVPKSIIYHAESFSFKWKPFKFYLLERNRQYCLLTHYSRKTFYKILPELILIEIAVLIFYTIKGLFLQKIKASLNILKNRKKINQKYNQIQQKRKFLDHEIIQYFDDEIIVPSELSKTVRNSTFLNFIEKLSKRARKKIISGNL